MEKDSLHHHTGSPKSEIIDYDTPVLRFFTLISDSLAVVADAMFATDRVRNINSVLICSSFHR